MSILVRNEKRKLLASYFNALASGTAIGGTLPLFAAWALGSSRITEAPFLLMFVAFVISFTIQAAAGRILNELEEAI